MLVLIRLVRQLKPSQGLSRNLAFVNGIAGILITAAGIILSFWGSHLSYGSRVLVVLLLSAGFAYLFSGKNRTHYLNINGIETAG